jgi:hypothetical protein
VSWCVRWRSVWLLVALLELASCKANYRVGDLVLVSWCGGQYPAYVIAQKGRGRYRVHFDGYDVRWDMDVTFQEIRQRLDTAPKAPPLCSSVAAAMEATKPDANASPYKEGARIRVRWRGSVYRASVVEVIGPDRIKVHYDGTESFLDEVVDRSRVVETP